MSDIDWDKIVESLDSITNECLKREIKNLNISIDLDKFNFAFSAITVPEIFSNIPNEIICQVTGVQADPSDMKAFSLFIIKGYIAFLYMRSDVIEKKLKKNNISTKSCIYQFSNLLSHDSESTVGQRIRNSLAHGGIFVDRKTAKFKFQDGNSWTSQISFENFDAICNHIKRFYLCAYEVQYNIQN